MDLELYCTTSSLSSSKHFKFSTFVELLKRIVVEYLLFGFFALVLFEEMRKRWFYAKLSIICFIV